MPSTFVNRGSRGGVILLVVVILLALFAGVGIAFVLYAQSHARSAQLFRDAEAQEGDTSLAALTHAFLLGLRYD